VIETRLRAAASADLVLAIYNPASRTRTHQVKQAKEILLEYRAANTPVVVGRAIGRADESLTVTPLADLDPDSVDMSCLLIIGSSQTRLTRAGVWTPRATDPPSR
jgi:precorrin-2 C20-methyltransferase / precorrin-3B C17-methyltransferase